MVKIVNGWEVYWLNGRILTAEDLIKLRNGKLIYMSRSGKTYEGVINGDGEEIAVGLYQIGKHRFWCQPKEFLPGIQVAVGYEDLNPCAWAWQPAVLVRDNLVVFAHVEDLLQVACNLYEGKDLGKEARELTRSFVRTTDVCQGYEEKVTIKFVNLFHGRYQYGPWHFVPHLLTCYVAPEPTCDVDRRLGLAVLAPEKGGDGSVLVRTAKLGSLRYAVKNLGMQGRFCGTSDPRIDVRPFAEKLGAEPINPHTLVWWGDTEVEILTWELGWEIYPSQVEELTEGLTEEEKKTFATFYLDRCETADYYPAVSIQVPKALFVRDRERYLSEAYDHLTRKVENFADEIRRGFDRQRR